MVDTKRLLIVGVGASAAGIEALEGVFGGVPDQPGFAVVVITHLDPARVSLLHKIVARHTRMPVHIAADGAEVTPGTVHVLPQNAVVGIEGGRLVVTHPDRNARIRKPVDVFLAALARDRGEHAAGVVLSGSDGDGTLGIKVMKEHGGLTMAQVRDGHGPGHPSMPDSAIATGALTAPLDKRHAEGDERAAITEDAR